MSVTTNLLTARPPATRHMRVGLLVLMLFGVSAALSVVGLGTVLRPAFPMIAMLLGAWLLATGRREDYVALTLWLFMLTPCLRRLVDFNAGWSLVNVLMLAPYVTAMLSVLPMLKMLKARRFAYSGLFAVVFACVGYGLVVAAIDNRFFGAIFDTLRWGVPPCFGLFIALDPERRRSYQQVVTRTMLLSLIVLSLYGIYQYLVVPPWDAMWMWESKMRSIGKPEPYLVRVFSTMNSPGSFSSYVMAALLLVMPAMGAMRLPAIGLGGIVLLLTLVRTSWLGLMVGFIFLLLFGASVRARFSILVALICLPLVVFGLAQIPQGAEIIDRRLNTLSGVQDDESFLDRSLGYKNFFYYELPAAPFGSGLGVTGAYQSYNASPNAKLVDGAIIEIGLALGVFAGGAYLLAILTTAVVACLASFRSKDTFLSSCGAVVAAQTIGLVGGMTTAGEIGMLFWITAGFCLMPQLVSRPAMRPRSIRPIGALLAKQSEPFR